MDIETLAVSTIESLIARCKHLQPLIDSNDKTPFTDGHIEIYSSPSRKKLDWTGRVAVQVKGRKAPRRPPKTNKFSIPRTDLLAFQRSRGVLYFVVSIDGAGNGTPYHAVLTPFLIQHLLDQVPTEQASVSVSLKPLPHTPEEIERIVHVALRGQHQNTSLGFDPVLFEKLQSINVFTANEINLDAPVVLTPGETDFVLEMRTSDGALVPLSGSFEISPPDYVPREVSATIRVGEFTYDHATVRRIDPDKSELILSEDLALILGIGNHFNINVTPSGNFAERYKALGFVMALADQGSMEINGRTLSLGYAAGNSSDIAEIRTHLNQLQELHDLFECLDVDESHIDWSEISEDQLRNLGRLHAAFVRGKNLTYDNGKTGWSIVAVGRWALMVLVMPTGEPNKWRLVDPFHPATPQAFRLSSEPNSDGAQFFTAYDIIEKENLPSLLNLHLESTTDAYEAIKDFEGVTSRANLFVLELISAADARPTRREEFLRGARRLNDWVISKEGESSIHLINNWQIEWRKGELTASDRQSIREMKRAAGHSEEPLASEIELACALLLNDAEEAAFLVDRFTDDKLEQVKSWPIWWLRDQPEAPTSLAATE